MNRRGAALLTLSGRTHLPPGAERGLDPLAAQRPHLELYIRWMQEIRRFKPSTVATTVPFGPTMTASCGST